MSNETPNQDSQAYRSMRSDLKSFTVACRHPYRRKTPSLSHGKINAITVLPVERTDLAFQTLVQSVFAP